MNISSPRYGITELTSICLYLLVSYNLSWPPPSHSLSAPVGGALFLAVQLSGEAQCGDLSLWPTVCCLWGHCINEVKIASLSRHHLHGHRVASVPVQPPINESPAAGWKLRSLPLTSLFLLFLFFLLPLPLLPLLPLLLYCLHPNYTKHWPQQTYIPITSQLPHWFTACNVQTYTNCDTFNNAKQSCKKKEDIISQNWCQGDTNTAEWKDCPDEKYLLYSQTVILPSIWSSPHVLRTADEGVHLFPWRLPPLTFNRAASELKVRPGVY